MTHWLYLHREFWWGFLIGSAAELLFVMWLLRQKIRRGLDEGCQVGVRPYWNTLLECTSETCHRPLPCPMHGGKPVSRFSLFRWLWDRVMWMRWFSRMG
jgi:hypothetical protein